MRIATIDVGTNTGMLFIAEVAGDGTLVPLHEARRFIRLGEGVDAARRVSEAAMHRLRAVLLEYKVLAATFGVTEIVIGATSASRDAVNQDALIDFVWRETGLHYEILSGAEEATWSFRGALSALDGLDGPCAVIDIGGGSTEIVVGEAMGAITARHSLDIGSVRLTERFFSQQPPRRREVARAVAFMTDTLDDAALPLRAALPLVSAAETPLLLALVHQGGMTWDDLGTPHVTITAATVQDWRRRLLTMTYDEVLALNPSLMQGRADVFPAAVLLFDTVLQVYGFPTCRVSPRSLRHGLALRYLAQHME